MRTKLRRLMVAANLLFVSCLGIYGEDGAGKLATYDAVVADPGHHRVVFENEKVRVLEVIVKPGEKEAFHVHLMPTVITIITGAKLRLTLATLEDDKVVIGKSMEIGNDNLQPPPLWMGPEMLHSFENIGAVTFHAYRVELKGEEGSKQTPGTGAATSP